MKDNIKIEFKTTRAVNSAHIGECIGVDNRGTLKQMLAGERRMSLEEALGVNAYLDILHNHIYELRALAIEATKNLDKKDYYAVYQSVAENFDKNL